MITQGNLEYQVIGNPPDYTRIWLRDVSWHFFNAFPGKASHHVEDLPDGRLYKMKIFRRRNTEVWMTCYELDETGRRDGVAEPEPIAMPLVLTAGDL